MTQYPHRLLILAPVASVPDVVQRIRAIAGPDAVPDDLGPPLNTTGDEKDAPEFHWCSGAFREDHTKAIVAELCKVAKVAPPADAVWDGATKGGKRDIVDAVRPVLKSEGIAVRLIDNQGTWPDPAEVLAEMGVKVRGEVKDAKPDVVPKDGGK